jgi:hypothetical protein
MFGLLKRKPAPERQISSFDTEAARMHRYLSRELPGCTIKTQRDQDRINITLPGGKVMPVHVDAFCDSSINDKFATEAARFAKRIMAQR